MSPELKNNILDPKNKNTKLDVKSDIFSIGIILLKSLCNLKEEEIMGLNND